MQDNENLDLKPDLSMASPQRPALCDVRHNVVLFDEVRDAFWLERMARMVTTGRGDLI